MTYTRVFIGAFVTALVAALLVPLAATPASAHISTCRPDSGFNYTSVTTPFLSGGRIVAATARVRCTDPADHAPYLSGYVVMQKWNGSAYASVNNGPTQVDSGEGPKDISPFNYQTDCTPGYWRAWVRYDYGGRNTYGKFSNVAYFNNC